METDDEQQQLLPHQLQAYVHLEQVQLCKTLQIHGRGLVHEKTDEQQLQIVVDREHIVIQQHQLEYE